MRTRAFVTAFTMHLLLVPSTHAEDDGGALSSIPVVARTNPHAWAASDLLLLRDIDALNVSPDASHFAVLIRQAVPERNTYRTGWFVGSTTGGNLTFLGAGGDARLAVWSNGTTGGEIAGGPGRWSPDGKWLAYAVKRSGEV